MKITLNQNYPYKLKIVDFHSQNIPETMINLKIFEGLLEEFYFHIESNTFFVGIGQSLKTLRYSDVFNCGVLAARKIKTFKINSLSLECPVCSSPNAPSKLAYFFYEGFLLEMEYTYTLKTKKAKASLQQISLSHIDETQLKQLTTLVHTRNITRELVDTPANILNPPAFVAFTKKLLHHTNIQMESFDQAKLQKHQCVGLLNISRGGEFAPQLLRLEYKSPQAKSTIHLIGKGITFDTGGYSLKPSDAMIDMKGDMAGAATTLGLMSAIEALKLPYHMVAWIPLCENVLDGISYKVGDVLHYPNGKSVEVTNTDAEGRLIIADALILSSKEAPDLIINIATLTGSVIAGLGYEIFGIFSNEKANSIAIQFENFVNHHTSENGWRLPLFNNYQKALKSTIADIQNTGSRMAGAICAGLFLNEFIPEHQPWIHLDIAGVYWGAKKSVFQSSATATPLESLLEYFIAES